MATVRVLLCIVCFAVVGWCGMFGSNLLKGLGRVKVDAARLSSCRYWMGEERYQRSLQFLRPKVYRKLVALAQGELWVRAETGNNDGERVEGYLASVVLEKGQPWCAALVSFIFKQAGYSAPRTGWSPSLFPVARLVKSAVPGNVYGIYFPAMKRIAHCGLVERCKGDFVYGIEGNTGAGGGRDGDGVYRKVRHKRTIYKYADWGRDYP